MPLINCKVELSLAWNPNCVPSHLDGASTFMIHNAKFYVPVLTLSTDDNAKLSNQLSEGFKTPIYWNKYKVVPKRSYDANASIKELIDSSCQGVKTLLVLAYEGGTNRVTVDSHKRYSLPKVKIKNYNFEIDGRNFYDQPINDLSRQYNEVRKVSTGQDDDYTTGCVLDFAHVRGNCRLTVANLSKKNALDADLRAIQQIYFTGKVETDAVIYYISEKPKETTLEFYKRTTKILWIAYVVEYSKVNVKLSDSQLNKLKTAVKNKTGTNLRTNIKISNENNLPHELLLTTRQKAKLRNAFENDMSTYIKISKAQISKIIQSGGFLGSRLSNIAGPLMKVGVPLAWFWNSNLNSFKGRNEWHVQALEDSNILWKGVTETIENETKEQKGRFLSMLLGTLGASLLGNLLSGKGIIRAGYGAKKANYGL